MAEQALATAFVTIVPSMKGFEGKLRGELGETMDNTGQEAGTRLGNSMAGSLRGALNVGLATVAVAGLATFVGGLIKSAEEGQKADAVLANITKSMGLFGNDTDKVTKRVQDFATAQMRLTGVDDDLIKGAQAKLMTFANLGATADTMGGAFDRATKLSLDLASAGFGSAESASVMLGKALNDPVTGMTALRRVGVALSADQEAQVRSFMELGDVASAQNVILQEVERQVGGTAEASATASSKLKAGWDDALQGLGTSLLPAFESIVNYLNDSVIPAVTAFTDWAQENPVIMSMLVGVVGALALAWLALSVAMWAASMTPIALIIGAIVIGVGLLIGAIVALVMNWDKVTAFISDTWQALSDWLAESFGYIAQWWNELWAGVGRFLSDTWNNIVNFLKGVVNFIVGLFMNWTVFGIIISNWDKISKFISDVWGGIVRFFQSSLSAVGGFFTTVFGNVANFIRDTFNNIVNFVKAPINAIIGIINGLIASINQIKIDIPDWVPGVGGKRLGFNIPKIPALAKGGFVDTPTLAMIGEAGPEVVTPLRDFERMMGTSGGGQTVNYYAAPNQSIDAEQALFTALKRAKVVASW